MRNKKPRRDGWFTGALALALSLKCLEFEPAKIIGIALWMGAVLFGWEM